MSPEELDDFGKAIGKGVADSLPKKPTHRNEWLSVGIVMIGWVATLSFFIGSMNQRVSSLENQQGQLIQTIKELMQTDFANSRFNDIQNQLNTQEKHLEYDDKRLDSIQHR